MAEQQLTLQSTFLIYKDRLIDEFKSNQLHWLYATIKKFFKSQQNLTIKKATYLLWH
jgi:hypothetical protein